MPQPRAGRQSARAPNKVTCLRFLGFLAMSGSLKLGYAYLDAPLWGSPTVSVSQAVPLETTATRDPEVARSRGSRPVEDRLATWDGTRYQRGRADDAQHQVDPDWALPGLLCRPPHVSAPERGGDIAHPPQRVATHCISCWLRCRTHGQLMGTARHALQLEGLTHCACFAPSPGGEGSRRTFSSRPPGLRAAERSSTTLRTRLQTPPWGCWG